MTLVGCYTLPVRLETLSPPTETFVLPPASPVSQGGETPYPDTTSTLEFSPGVVTLRIWLPPQFNPDAGTLASDLLKSRLEAFASQNPSVRLEVRIKALDGPGGLLDSLAAASAAAPLALPDLVALPRPMLESAALKGLLYPYDLQGVVPDDNDWYEYARRLAHLQDILFGLPFAGDVLLLVCTPLLVESPPGSWEEVVSLGQVLAFPAADPNALYTLALYQAAGGQIQDTLGRPAISPDALEQVLTFYQQAGQAGVMPYWLTQYQTDDQAWTVFIEGQATMAVAWYSHFRQGAVGLPMKIYAAPLPTPNGVPFTLATGWVWALASPDPERRELSARLAIFLTDGAFLSTWTLTAGYLPPSSSALSAWSDVSLRNLADQLASSARLMPPAEVLSALGPAVEDAVIQVLKHQADPRLTAQVVAERLNRP